MTSLDYIHENFLTLEELSKQHFLSIELLQHYIDAGCLPKPSYKVTNSVTIDSVLGHCEEESDMIGYFPKSYQSKFELIHSLASKMSIQEVKKFLYERFINIYAETLHECEAHLWGLASYISSDGILCSEGKKFIDEEWHHYIAGTYGLCTKSATTKDIAIKEASVAKITHLLSLNETAALSNEQCENLKSAVDALDKVSALFAPHELASSSRQKYINDVRSKFGWT